MEGSDRLKTLLETVISLGLCGELEAHAKAYGAEHTTAYWCGAMETLIGFGRSKRSRRNTREEEEEEEKEAAWALQ